MTVRPIAAAAILSLCGDREGLRGQELATGYGGPSLVLIAGCVVLGYRFVLFVITLYGT
jgi:hypothetical protein